MPRTKNPELREKLELVIQDCLEKRGLDETSYQLVSERAGISRALVQHYYPSKFDFAVSYLNKLLDTIAEVLDIVEYSDHSKITYDEAAMMGCLYYGYLLSRDGGRLLLFDILKNRELADELMRGHYEWCLRWLDTSLSDFEHRPQSIIENMGGFYELMYNSIKHDFEIDIPSKVLSMLSLVSDDEVDSQFLKQNSADMLLNPDLMNELKTMMARPQQNNAVSDAELVAQFD